MIDETHRLSIAKQARPFALSRSDHMILPSSAKGFLLAGLAITLRKTINEWRGMKVGLRKRRNGAVLVVEGEIDRASLGQLVAAFAALADSTSPVLRLDFSKVTYIDSAGLSALYQLAEVTKGRRAIEIIGVSPFLWRVLEVAGLTIDERVYVAQKAETPAVPELARTGPPETRGPHSQECTFPPRLDQLALIREFVRKVAAEAALENARIFDLQVAVSEASANAIEHGVGEGDLEVSAKRRRGRLTLTVSHPGGFRPRASDEPARAHRGMGLPLMLALTDEVTVTRPVRGGTSVSLCVFLH